MVRSAFRSGMTGRGYRLFRPVSLRSRLRYRVSEGALYRDADGEETVLARRKPSMSFRYDGSRLSRAAARQYQA